MPLISIVVPCYNEQESLPIFLKELDGVVRIMTQQYPEISFEAVLIDDGSADNTLAVMKAETAAAHPYAIHWHSFSHNFGKEAALFAGLQHAKGDYVATMDADMQDPPSLLPQMYEILQTENYDNVATRRTTREGEPPIRSFCARMFYKIINRISKADIVDGARDFRLMKRPMVNAIISMGEYNRFSKGIYGWVGFKTKWLPYVNINRVPARPNGAFGRCSSIPSTASSRFPRRRSPSPPSRVSFSVSLPSWDSSSSWSKRLFGVTPSADGHPSPAS